MARAVDVISRPWRFAGVTAKSADQGRTFAPLHLSENLTEVTAIRLAALSYLLHRAEMGGKTSGDCFLPRTSYQKCIHANTAGSQKGPKLLAQIINSD